MAGRRKRPPALSPSICWGSGPQVPEGFVAQCEEWGGVKALLTPSTGTTSREGSPLRRCTASEGPGSSPPPSETESKPTVTVMTPTSTLSSDFFEVKCMDELAFLGKLGQGSSGLVEKHLHKATGLEIALKIIPVSDIAEKFRQSILLELRTFAKCDNPHIVSFFGCFFSSNSIHIALEYMNGGALSDVLAKRGTVPEKHLRNISHQVLAGLEHLHCEMHVIHRDIKPSNLLLNSAGIVKITDFGVSGELEDNVDMKEKVTWVGTVHYMSPERIVGKGYKFDSDMWSFGLTLVECCLGRHPYANSKEDAQRKSFWELMNCVLVHPPPVLPTDAGFSEDLQDFVVRVLVKNPAQRPGVATMRAHAFVAVEPGQAEKAELASWIVESSSLAGAGGADAPQSHDSSALRAELASWIADTSRRPDMGTLLASVTDMMNADSQEVVAPQRAEITPPTSAESDGGCRLTRPPSAGTSPSVDGCGMFSKSFRGGQNPFLNCMALPLESSPDEAADVAPLVSSPLLPGESVLEPRLPDGPPKRTGRKASSLFRARSAQLQEE